MNNDLIQFAQTYAMRNGRQLAERVGFGMHGIVYTTQDNVSRGKSAIKVHEFTEPFLRELAIYQRLQAIEITDILGFHVPQLLGADERLRVIEMSVVTRPFLLDFAGAYLDVPPDFPDEVWDHWETERREQFGEKWPTVLKVLAALEDFVIYMVDVSPSNIAFAD